MAPPQALCGLTLHDNAGFLGLVSPLYLSVGLTFVCFGLLAVSRQLTFLDDDFSSPPRRIVATVLLLLLLTAVVFYPLAGGGRTVDVDVDSLWFPALFAGHGVMLLFLLAWWVLRPRHRVVGQLMHLAEVGHDLRTGLYLGVGGWAITIGVTMTAGLLAMTLGATTGEVQEVPPLIRWLVALPLTHKLLIIAAAMTVEELLFRGFLQRRIGLGWSSVLFALAHASYGLPFLVIGVFTISLVIGRALKSRGRLLPCIVAHGVFDAIQLLLILPAALRMMPAV